jgi:hypothetical protein
MLVTLALSGCDFLSPRGCVADIAPGGFQLTIADSVSNAPLAFGSTATATEESTHTLFIFSPALTADQTTIGLYEGTVSGSGVFFGPGRYSVRVERPGYLAWTRSGMVLETLPGPCGGLPFIVLTARLMPAP